MFWFLGWQTAADITHNVIKKLVETCVEGAKVLDLCIEGDKLIEEGTAAVYNKAVKGVEVTKGVRGFAGKYLAICSCLKFITPLRLDVPDDKASPSRPAYPLTTASRISLRYRTLS